MGGRRRACRAIAVNVGSADKVPEAGISRGEPMKWQPIETAPKDGHRSIILVWDGKDILTAYAYTNNRGETYWWDGYSQCMEIDPPPTHWMPLPEPPA